MNENNLKPILIHVSAVIVSEDRFLIIKRSSEDSYHQDLWELPGGKVDAGDTLEDAISREVFEETGIQLKNEVTPFIFENHIEKEYKKYLNFLVVLVGFVVNINNIEVQLSEEHDDFRWINFSEIEKFNIDNNSKLLIHNAIQNKRI